MTDRQKRFLVAAYNASNSGRAIFGIDAPASALVMPPADAWDIVNALRPEYLSLTDTLRLTFTPEGREAAREAIEQKGQGVIVEETVINHPALSQPYVHMDIILSVPELSRFYRTKKAIKSFWDEHVTDVLRQIVAAVIGGLLLIGVLAIVYRHYHFNGMTLETNPTATVAPVPDKLAQATPIPSTVPAPISATPVPSGSPQTTKDILKNLDNLLPKKGYPMPTTADAQDYYNKTASWPPTTKP